MSIEEINNLGELLTGPYLEDPRTSLFLDIDDTLISADKAHENCPNKFFRYNFEHAIKQGCYKIHNNRFMSYHNPHYLSLVKQYNNSVKQCKWKLTDPGNRDIMYTLNTSQVRYHFLTARGVELHRHTKYWLQRLKLYPKPGNYMNRGQVVVDIPNVTGRSGIRGNIIYAGGYDKLQLLKEVQFPTHQTVIMVDDSLSNLESFERYYVNNKIVKFWGLHYVKKI